LVCLLNWVSRCLFGCFVRDTCGWLFHFLMLVLITFHSIAYLDLDFNDLTGSMPSQIRYLTQLSESSYTVVWFLVLSIVLFVFSLHSNACCPVILQLSWISHSIVWRELFQVKLLDP
jgi:hypothetical protein